MQTDRSGLVGIVRDFLLVHRDMQALLARFRNGMLAFDDVSRLVGDSDDSRLFRLKERCHALFRSGDATSGGVALSEALFDLAVGSLFHEAMKFRENFYQREIYGPRVRALRSEAGAAAEELFREFEKILAGSDGRLLEAVQESEALLEQTRNQLRVLLLHYREDGHVMRCLMEQAPLIDELLPDEGLVGLLAAMHGDAADGYLAAARSYLVSAHFIEGVEALDEARKLSGDRDDIERLSLYAEGMQAFLAGDYAQSLDVLGRWMAASPPAEEAPFGRLAADALSHVGKLVLGPERDALAKQATRLGAEIRDRLCPVVSAESAS